MFVVCTLVLALFSIHEKVMHMLEMCCLACVSSVYSCICDIFHVWKSDALARNVFSVCTLVLALFSTHGKVLHMLEMCCLAGVSSVCSRTSVIFHTWKDAAHARDVLPRMCS